MSSTSKRVRSSSRRSTRLADSVSAIFFEQLPLLVQQLIVNECLPIREVLMCEVAAKRMARVVIDWRALARRALAMVESLDDDATVDSDSLRQFAVVREGAHRKSNNDFWICFDNVRRLNLSNRAMFRARLATRGTAHNRLFKQIYCDTMRLWGCIECERVCFNFHFGHVLHEVCLVRANKLCRQTKQPEKYTLLQRGELNSKHRELRDTVEEFQFLVKNVGSPISTVWPRQVAAQHRALGAPRPRVDKQHCAMCKCFKDSSALLL